MAVLLALLIETVSFCGAAAADGDPAEELIKELMCPSPAYSQPLATSNAPEAVWMRSFIRAKVAQGWSKQRIVDTLVWQYGERIMGVPPKRGFGLAAWVTPFATIFGGAALLGVILIRWLRERRWHDAYLDALIARTVDENDLKRYEARLLRELEQFE